MEVLAYIISFWILGLFTFNYFNKRSEQITTAALDHKIMFQQDSLNELNNLYLKSRAIISELEVQVSNLERKFNNVDKTAEDAKKLVSQIGIAQAFIPRNKRENTKAN